MPSWGVEVSLVMYVKFVVCPLRFRASSQCCLLVGICMFYFSYKLCNI